jgi:hypothetical protein
MNRFLVATVGCILLIASYGYWQKFCDQGKP